MEGSSISALQKENKGDADDLYVEEYTVAEVSLDEDTGTIQHEVEAFQDGTDDDDMEEGNTIQYETQDHRYISQPEGFKELKDSKQHGTTRYIICSPDEPIGTGWKDDCMHLRIAGFKTSRAVISACHFSTSALVASRYSIESYKASWTRGMTQILIEEYRNMVDEFRNPHKKQKDLWYDLSKNMCKRGCDVSWDMCDRKWRNLKHTFKTIYYNQQRSSKSKRRWEFYNALEELFLAQGADETLRKSRHVSPPPLLEDQDSMSAGTASIGLNPRPAKHPRISPVVPQVSYAQVVDVSNLSNLQNQIVSFPQIVLCDEDGIPINKKTTVASTSVPITKMTDESDSAPDSPPSWFKEFMKQYKVDEERRLSALKEMHAEVIQVEKRKCVALESLLKKLV